MSDKVYVGHKGSKIKSTTHKRSKINNRRPLNRHSLERDSEYVSASAKKLKLADSNDDREVDDGFGYRFVNFMTVFTTLSQIIVCRKCKGDVRFTEGSKRGLGFKIIVSCDACGEFYIVIYLYI